MRMLPHRPPRLPLLESAVPICLRSHLHAKARVDDGRQEGMGAGKRLAADFVLTEHRDAVAIVTMNRPDVLNALGNEMLGAVADTLSQLDRQDHVHSMVLTGG